MEGGGCCSETAAAVKYRLRAGKFDTIVSRQLRHQGTEALRIFWIQLQSAKALNLRYWRKIFIQKYLVLTKKGHVTSRTHKHTLRHE